MLIFIHRVVLTAVRVRGEEQQDGRGDGGVDGHRHSLLGSRDMEPALWSPTTERGVRRRDAQPLGRGPVARDEHKPQRREIQEMEAKREKVACVCRQFKFVPLL